MNRRQQPELDVRQKIAHACFECHKSWKLSAGREAVCPQCGRPLREMGRSFKAPRKGDLKQWRKVQRLWESGFRFSSHGHSDDGEPFPENLNEVEEFISPNPKHPWRIAV